MVLLSIVGIAIILLSNHNSLVTAPVFAVEPPIDNIECGAMEQFGFHIHAHLDIFINTTDYAVPALIGITGNCFYWLPTHDQSGIIHIESPEKKDFTLGRFFDIWKNKFELESIFNNTIINDTSLTVYLNGEIVKNATNFRDMVLNPHDEIAIIYGEHPSFIPKSYSFASRL